MTNFQRIRKSWNLQDTKDKKTNIEGKNIIIIQDGKTISGLVKKVILNKDKADIYFFESIVYQGTPTDFLEIEKSLPELEKGVKEINQEDYKFKISYRNLNSGNIRLYIEA